MNERVTETAARSVQEGQLTTRFVKVRHDVERLADIRKPELR